MAEVRSRQGPKRTRVSLDDYVSLSCNAARSARARHETHANQWQPEPVDTGATAERAAEDGEALARALRLTLEKLSASERAAYVLRHTCDYPYEQIAEIIQHTQGSVRQHVSERASAWAWRNVPRSIRPSIGNFWMPL